MSFADIKDQEVAVRLLGNVLKNGRIPNAFLFCGPGGVGKRMAAIELAKAINCASGSADACNECLACRKVGHGNHPDVKFVAPSGSSREIRKQDADEINELAALRPFESAWRVFILQDAERMNATAQNHFLKTLEEPPGRSLFILLSEYPRTLLPTIRSRCQMVRFRGLRPGTVAAILQQERDLPSDLARSIAEIAEGQMSRAFDLVDSEKREVLLAITTGLADGGDPVRQADEFWAFLQDQQKRMEQMVKAELGIDEEGAASREDLQRLKDERVARLNALVKRDILEYLYLMETWYRDEMVYSATKDGERVWNRDQLDRFAAGTSTDPVAKIRAIEQARIYLDRNIPGDRVFRDLFFSLAAP
jgi:DNA polymerase III delta' subunit